MSAADYYLGLISGTSVDGIDVAVIRVAPDGKPACVHGATIAYSPALRADIARLIRNGVTNLAQLGRTDVATGVAFADAVSYTLRAQGLTQSDIVAIGSHGQTVWHDPTGALPCTLQIGDPNVIAARTGITVVADFRRMDVALGGQGAPLVPPFHARAFGDHKQARAVVNLGGIANVTLLDGGDVRGFDSGPASALMDAWCALHHGTDYDANGEWARSGSVHAALLGVLLDDAFVRSAPPKSTGKERFNLAYVEAALARLDAPVAPADVQATLCEFTARTVADALTAHGKNARRVLVCGGGVHNTWLLQRLGHHLPGIALESTAAYGIDPDMVEACAFGWLACQRLRGQINTLASVTGAQRDSVGGAVYAGDPSAPQSAPAHPRPGTGAGAG